MKSFREIIDERADVVIRESVNLSQMGFTLGDSWWVKDVFFREFGNDEKCMLMTIDFNDSEKVRIVPCPQCANK